ncbi:MAG TPA: hypothetical protein VGZ27_15400, partial [Vicinamibacterales bacterium]|nr:hypothetical protein [Vicinamibacterales bacterium]
MVKNTLLCLVTLAALLGCSSTVHAQTFKVGTFTKVSTVSSQTIAHGLGATPSAIILWSSGSTTGTGFGNSFWSAFGVSDGTTSRSSAAASQNGNANSPGPGSAASRRTAAKAITFVTIGQVPQADADVTWDATNFYLNWTSNTANTGWVIHFIALSGVTAKVVDWSAPAGTGTVAVNTVGFQPTAVIHFGNHDTAYPSSIFDAAFMLGVMDGDGNQWATDYRVASSSNNSPAYRAQRTDACIEQTSVSSATETMRATYVSMDATGFTVNFTTNTDGASHFFSLALKGVTAKAGSFLKSPLFIQQPVGGGTKVGAVATIAGAFPAASAYGNLIVVTIQHDSLTGTISSVTDDHGNTYNLAVGPTNWPSGTGTTTHTSTYYASNITGGGAAIHITVNLTNAAAGFLELYQSEYAGVAQSNPLDQTSSAFAAVGNAPNSAAKTTTQADELIYGFSAGWTGTIGNGATFTSRSVLDGNATEDKNVTAAGSYSAAFTDTASDHWVAQMATFKGFQSASGITGLGFQPSVLLLASDQDIPQTTPTVTARMSIGAGDGTASGSAAVTNNQGVTPTSVQNYDIGTKIFTKINNNTSTIDAQASLVSLDADGFTLNWTTNDTVATQILYLAIVPQSVVTAVRLASLTATRYDRGVLVDWAT